MQTNNDAPAIQASIKHEFRGVVDDNAISVIDYDKKGYSESLALDVSECFAPKKKNTIRWINIDNNINTDIIEAIGQQYNLHPLLQEDIMSLNQRPKIEEFKDHIFIICKMLSYDDLMDEIRFEQLSIVLTKDTVITFGERRGDVFEPIRERIRNDKGLLRSGDASFLVYSLLDVIVDNYFLILENLSDRIETIEDQVVEKPAPTVLSVIHDLKVQMVTLRKAVWPLRDIVAHMERCGSPLLSEITKLYLHDVYDHTIQVMDSVETYRDILAGLLDIYVSNISNRLNEIMKFLTIIGTIFIPLTFIAGVYGMNFRFMPEIEQWWGYPMAIALMTGTAGIMIWYIKKRGWL
jgi:magnesium transporter